MAEPNGRRTRGPKLAAVGVVAALAAALALNQRSVALDLVGRVANEVYSVAWVLTWYPGAILLLAATIAGTRRNDRLAILALAASLMWAVVQILYLYGGTTIVHDTGFRPLLIPFVSGSFGFFLISLLLLLLHNLRPSLAWVKRSTVALLCALLIVPQAFHALGIQHSAIRDVFLAVMACAALLSVMFSSWCIAFRQIQPDRTPRDSARQVALTCPRCGVAAEVPVGYGECVNCRLQISISVEEGVCAKCGYRLRGLTGEKCPECGTEIGKRAG